MQHYITVAEGGSRVKGTHSAHMEFKSAGLLRGPTLPNSHHRARMAVDKSKDIIYSAGGTQSEALTTMCTPWRD